MAKVKTVKPEERQAVLNASLKDGARSLSTGISIPVGKHSFIVADKDAFGFLYVTSRAGTPEAQDWVLPIVAGTMECENGQVIDFVISDKSGANTLVIPDKMYFEMQLSGDYILTVENRNGRNVVTGLEALVKEVA